MRDSTKYSCGPMPAAMALNAKFTRTFCVDAPIPGISAGIVLTRICYQPNAILRTATAILLFVRANDFLLAAMPRIVLRQEPRR